MKTMVPINSIKGLRLLSDKVVFNSELQSLHNPVMQGFYGSKKDRILKFKERSDANSLQDLTHLIRELNTLGDRGSIENKLLSDLQGFFAKEYAYLFDLTQDQAYTTVVQKCKVIEVNKDDKEKMS